VFRVSVLPKLDASMMMGFNFQLAPSTNGSFVDNTLKRIHGSKVRRGRQCVRNGRPRSARRLSSSLEGSTFSSVRLGDTTSPSRVVRAWISSTRIFASIMCDRRRSPTRNMKHSLPSRRHTTAVLLNCSVRVLCFGRTIFRNTSPTCRTYREVTLLARSKELQI
jgi:hypothetical protein